MGVVPMKTMTSAEANALKEKTSDFIYYDTDINTFLRWNGFAFIPALPGFDTYTKNIKLTEPGGTYDLSQDPKPSYIRVIVIGGAGGSSGDSQGKDGGQSVFGDKLLVAGGGIGATVDKVDSAGGEATIASTESSPIGIAIAGYMNDKEYDKSSLLKKSDNHGKGGDGNGNIGGAGGFVTAIINNPEDSYNYEIGSGGEGGKNGQPGNPGVIEVTEYYQ